MDNQVQNPIQQVNPINSVPTPENTLPPLQSKNPEITVKSKKKLLKIFPREGILGVISKFIVASGIFFIVFGIIVLIVFFTNLDTQFIKLKLQANVIGLDEPIEGAKIYYNDELITETDSNGAFTIGKLNPGKITLEIKADGFKDLEEEVSLGRSFMDYTVEKTFVLQSENESSLKGKFIVEDPDYDFLNDKIVINDTVKSKTYEYKINSDGSFSLKNIPLKPEFNYQSLNYKDIKKTLTLKSGSNTLEDIELVPAGDIEGELLSYIKEDLVSDIDIQVENIDAEQLIINEEKFSIVDLEVGREYAIRVIAPGYIPRDYTITIVQGENQLFNFRLVEEGITTFFKADDSDFNFYYSQFDGEGLIKLTNFNNIEVSYEHFDRVDNKIYFLTVTQAVRNTFGGRGVTPYSINLATGSLDHLLTNSSDIGILYPNFIAKKMINVTTNQQQTSKRIQFMDLNGENRSDLRTSTAEEIRDVHLSDNGKFIYFLEGEEGEEILYQINTETKQFSDISTKEGIDILDVSPDGNKVVFLSNNTSESFKDLIMYTSNTVQTRTIQVNAEGNDYQFLDSDNSTLLYWADEGGKNNIFTYNLDSSSSKQITQLGTADKISSVYQQSDKVFYITSKGLYVLDLASPHSLKLVNEGEFLYVGK